MHKLKSILLLIIIVTTFISCKRIVEADILIVNGTVYNGIDTNSNNSSIAIKGDKIVFVGDANAVYFHAKKQ